MKYQTKAQGISINTIIIAAIALIVLVVLVAIFTGRLGIFSMGVQSCTDKGGTCASSCIAPDYATLRGTDCDKAGEVCCIPTIAPE